VLITEFWASAKVQLSLKPLLSSGLFPTGPFISFRRLSPQIYTFALRLLFLGSVLGCLVLSKGSKGCGYRDRRPSGPESSTTQERLLCSSGVEEISQLYRSRADAAFSFHGPLYSSWLRSGLFEIFNKVVGLLSLVSIFGFA